MSRNPQTASVAARDKAIRNANAAYGHHKRKCGHKKRLGSLLFKRPARKDPRIGTM